MKKVKLLLVATTFAILIFFAVSFVTVLLHISPLHIYRNDDLYRFSIGFPFEYYYQFAVRASPYPDFGWSLPYLLADCGITWVVVTWLFFIYKSLKNRS